MQFNDPFQFDDSIQFGVPIQLEESTALRAARVSESAPLRHVELNRIFELD